MLARFLIKKECIGKDEKCVEILVSVHHRNPGAPAVNSHTKRCLKSRIQVNYTSLILIRKILIVENIKNKRKCAY